MSCIKFPSIHDSFVAVKALGFDIQIKDNHQLPIRSLLLSLGS